MADMDDISKDLQQIFGFSVSWEALIINLASLFFYYSHLIWCNFLMIFQIEAH